VLPAGLTITDLAAAANACSESPATGWIPASHPGQAERTGNAAARNGRRVTYAQQLGHDDGRVVLINHFTLAPEDTGQFLQVWADDSAFITAARLYLCPVVPRHRWQHDLHQRCRLGVRPGAWHGSSRR
jgi:hypothetical protein